LALLCNLSYRQKALSSLGGATEVARSQLKPQRRLSPTSGHTAHAHLASNSDARPSLSTVCLSVRLSVRLSVCLCCRKQKKKKPTESPKVGERLCMESPARSMRHLQTRAARKRLLRPGDIIGEHWRLLLVVLLLCLQSQLFASFLFAFPLGQKFSFFPLHHCATWATLCCSFRRVSLATEPTLSSGPI